ncbi:MAG TPA: hypothetical protein VG938_10205 [Verrucomicrobiae bacterium]|jgi:hypothetical protein|nr:hypothetical protein [Verrucomicrobiae bacterium]
MNQDEEHLRLLSIFYYVCAGFAALFACLPIIHLIMGIVLLFHPESFGPANGAPPAFFGIFFIVFALLTILAGWAFAGLLVYAGRCLGQRKHYTFCLVVAAIACLFMPFGTILGIFTIIVLVRPTVKPLFKTAIPPAYAQ